MAERAVLSLISPAGLRVGGPGAWRLRVDLPEGLSCGEAVVVSLHGARDLLSPDCYSTCPRVADLRAGGLDLSFEWGNRTRSADGVYDGRVGKHASVTAQADLPRGASFELVVGDVGDGAFSCQHYAQILRTEVLVVADGRIVYSAPGPDLRIEPDRPARAYAVARSVGEDSQVRLQLLDHFGNVVSVERVSGEVRDVRLGDRLVRRIAASAAGMAAESNPQLVEGAGGLSLFWGDPHIHTALSDGAMRPDEAYAWARERGCLDFASVTDHDASWRPLGEAEWEELRRAAADAYEPGAFVTLLGYEWSNRGEGWTEGHRNVYFPGDSGRLIHSHEGPGRTVAGLLRSLEGTGVLVVPHHSAAPQPTHGTDWSVRDMRLQRLVEVCSKWGVSERRGTPRPLTNPVGSTVQDALAAGHRLGFVGGGDTHTSMGGSRIAETPRHNLRYAEGGLTAVWAAELTREAVFEALRARRCYATTGERILLLFQVDGCGMGSELVASSPDAPRTVRAFVAGTGRIARVDVVRSGEDVATFSPDAAEYELEWTDADPLPPSGFYYYLRVIQADGHMAFSSPVWIDAPPSGAGG